MYKHVNNNFSLHYNPWKSRTERLGVLDHIIYKIIAVCYHKVEVRDCSMEYVD
jgi:hypothetical protein